MSKDAKNVPALRFKGYSDAWEKRKFKDLVVRVNKTSDDSTIPSVEFEDIISKQGRLNKDVRLKINSKQGIYFEPQDVLFGKLRPYLQNWLFPSFYGRAVGDFWVLRANSSVLSEYLFVLIQSPRFQIVANISSGTKMPRSDWNTVSNTSFPIPVQSEQRKIWQLFNVLDNLIAATQHNIDALEQAKKALLQRLFDQSWRFKGYSDPWEKRKLGDLGSVAMNKRIYKDQTSDEGEIPFYKIGSFGKQADAFISRKLFNEYKKLYPFPKKGDILISASGSIGRTIVYNGEDAYFQDSNIIWIQHDNRLDNTFLHQLFNIIRWSGVEGTTIKRLYNKNILSTQILLPSVEEQRSIGNLLDNVDNLIAATQSRLSSLELLKKALLQDLFI